MKSLRIFSPTHLCESLEYIDRGKVERSATFSVWIFIKLFANKLKRIVLQQNHIHRDYFYWRRERMEPAASAFRVTSVDFMLRNAHSGDAANRNIIKLCWHNRTCVFDIVSVSLSLNWTPSLIAGPYKNLKWNFSFRAILYLVLDA